MRPPPTEVMVLCIRYEYLRQHACMAWKMSDGTRMRVARALIQAIPTSTCNQAGDSDQHYPQRHKLLKCTCRMAMNCRNFVAPLWRSIIGVDRLWECTLPCFLHSECWHKYLDQKGRSLRWHESQGPCCEEQSQRKSGRIEQPAGPCQAE